MLRNHVNIVPNLPEVTTAACWKGIEWGYFLKLIIQDEVLIYGLIIAIADQIVSSFTLEPNFSITMHYDFRSFALYLKPKVAFALAVILKLQQFLVDGVQSKQSTLEGRAFPLEADLP